MPVLGLHWERLGAVKNAEGPRKSTSKVSILLVGKKGLMVAKLTEKCIKKFSVAFLWIAAELDCFSRFTNLQGNSLFHYFRLVFYLQASVHVIYSLTYM